MLILGFVLAFGFIAVGQIKMNDAFIQGSRLAAFGWLLFALFGVGILVAIVRTL